MPSPHAQNFVKESIALRPWTGPVLDLGAGDVSNWYRPLFPDTDYKTLDIEAGEKKEIDIVADMTNMPKVKSGKYGVVLLLETLEHVNNPFKAFKEAARVLKPGGILICTTVACYNQHQHPKDYWRFLPDGLEFLCEEAGLTILNSHLSSPDTLRPSFCMIAAYKDENKTA